MGWDKTIMFLNSMMQSDGHFLLCSIAIKWEMHAKGIVSENSFYQEHTYKTEANEEHQRHGGQAQQPAPAQSGHDQNGQQDLRHSTNGPEDLTTHTNARPSLVFSTLQCIKGMHQ